MVMKFVQEYCSICRKEQAMPVIQEDAGQAGLIWAQCPVCKEIKPLDVTRTGKSGHPFPDPSLSSDPDPNPGPRRVVRHYRVGERFALGEWIYHPEWDDTGEIIEAHRSRGGREIIVVAFEKCGTKRLVANFAR
jgi:hypothetical protein